MSRPPALTPQQQDDVRARLAAGEGVRALSREYSVGTATIRRLAAHSAQVRNVAEMVAGAQTALAALPIPQQHVALSLAEKLRNISISLASAAELGARTSHRLHALANQQVSKVDDADPMSSIGELRDVGVLTKLANDSASIAINLMAANKPTIERLNQEPPAAPQFDVSALSNSALQELLAARG